ncbi:SlyX family protein [Halobacteriovorax sp. HLS]|uniref:SlyX family protein n=1 Tax=Halobacteriovorax sp. HLS TaxID=2234000 RepID=UPI000FD7694F|nr:SlyX family protein [Halobacteriovorax sp. HLS]
MKELEERLIALEEKFSYQDQLVTELNKIVSDQQLTISQLIREVKGLSEMNEGGASARSLKDDVPPHY